MKKIILSMLAIVIAYSFYSCTKVETTPPQNGTGGPTIPVTFYPDSSVTDQTIQPPKNKQLLFSGIFNTGSINSFGVTNIKVTLKQGGDGASPFTYLRQLYATIEGGSPVKVTEIKDSVPSNEFSFNSFVFNIPQYQTRSVRLYGDILSSATNNTGAEDNLIVSIQLTYTGYDGSAVVYFPPKVATGHKTIFSTTPPPFTVVSVADPATPAPGVILDGQEKPGITYGVKLLGVSGNVTEHRLLVQGQASNAVTALKLFDATGTTFIAQANVVNGVAVIATNDALSAGLQKNYMVKPVVTVTSGDVSNYDFNIVLDAVKAVSTAGEQKTDGTDRTGNSFRVLKAMLDIKKVSVPTLTITNGMMDLYTIDATAINGDVSLKELAYAITLNDQHGFDDTLFLKLFQILDGAGADITNQFRFTDIGGVVDTLFSESDTKLRTTRISGTGETVIPAGTTKRFRLRAFVGGFNHPLDGDGFSVVPIVDATSSVGLKYLNTGGLTNGNARLDASPTPNGGAQNFNLVWSDISSPYHDGSFSPTSKSNDWMNSEKVSYMLTPNNFHQ